MLDDVVRDDWGRVLASLVGWLGDIELAEDAAPGWYSDVLWPISCESSGRHTS